MKPLLLGFLLSVVAAAAFKRLPDPHESYSHRPVRPEPLPAAPLPPERRTTMRSKFFGTKRRKVATIAAVVALIAAGSAYAVWLINGFGNARAKVGTLQALNVTMPTPARVVGDLFPGQTGSLYFDVGNPNNVDLELGFVGPGASGISSDNPTACPASNLTFTGVTTSLLLPAGETVEVTLPNAVTLSASAPDGCQGNAFTVPVEARAATLP